MLLLIKAGGSNGVGNEKPLSVGFHGGGRDGGGTGQLMRDGGLSSVNRSYM